MVDKKSERPTDVQGSEGGSVFIQRIENDPVFAANLYKLIEQAAWHWVPEMLVDERWDPENIWTLRQTVKEKTQELWLNLRKGEGGETYLSTPPEEKWRYIYGSMYRLCCKEWRKRQREPLFNDDTVNEQIPDASATPEETAYQGELLRKAEQYLNRLTDLEREVIVLHEQDGLAFETIAAKVGKSKSRVFQAYGKAMTKIEGYKANDRQ